ncbi:hypothetical protein QD840_004540 [Citrobacter koseri]
MGLDIYFYASEKRGADKSRIPGSRYAEADSDGDIEVGYFRKVNALFKWVHDHIGAFENCEKVPVTEAHLRALQQDLQALTPKTVRHVFRPQRAFSLVQQLMMRRTGLMWKTSDAGCQR